MVERVNGGGTIDGRVLTNLDWFWWVWMFFGEFGWVLNGLGRRWRIWMCFGGLDGVWMGFGWIGKIPIKQLLQSIWRLHGGGFLKSIKKDWLSEGKDL